MFNSSVQSVRKIVNVSRRYPWHSAMILNRIAPSNAMTAVTVGASKSADAFLLDRLYILAAMTPRNMQSIPTLVPPTENAGENTVATATPANVMIRLSTSFTSARCLKSKIPRISVMLGMVATKIALIEADVSLMPNVSKIEYAHGSNNPVKKRNSRFFLPRKWMRIFPHRIKIKNKSAVIPHLAASNCTGAISFNKTAREIKEIPQPIETIAIKNTNKPIFCSLLYILYIVVF